MRRQVSMDEISDGRLYGLNDMVKADCQGCDGCSACCRGMGESVVLTPLDLYRLEMGLGCSFGELLVDRIELNLADGLILPNLKMKRENEACVFLNQSGRCSVHGMRPDICRLFPLGRFYEEDGFRYFLQVHECAKKNRMKVKVKKWLDIPDLARHETFIQDWHDYRKETGEALDADGREETRREVTMRILKLFYIRPYEKERDFYEQFYERLEEAKGL